MQHCPAGPATERGSFTPIKPREGSQRVRILNGTKVSSVRPETRHHNIDFTCEPRFPHVIRVVESEPCPWNRWGGSSSIQTSFVPRSHTRQYSRSMRFQKHLDGQLAPNDVASVEGVASRDLLLRLFKAGHCVQGGLVTACGIRPRADFSVSLQRKKALQCKEAQHVRQILVLSQ